MGYYIRELKNKVQSPKWKVQFLTYGKVLQKAAVLARGHNLDIRTENEKTSKGKRHT
jgi:hypothetical protein